MGAEHDGRRQRAEDADSDTECILSKIGLPVAKLTEEDSLLVRAGLVRGPIGVLKHAGKAGLKVVGLEAPGPSEAGGTEITE